MTVSSSARRAEGEPKAEDMLRRGVCGLVGKPGWVEGGERMLETLRWAAGAVEVDMLLHLLEREILGCPAGRAVDVYGAVEVGWLG